MKRKFEIPYRVQRGLQYAIYRMMRTGDIGPLTERAQRDIELAYEWWEREVGDVTK